MMKNIPKITILALVFYIYITNAFAELQTPNQEPNKPAYLKPISPDELKEDLDFLFKTIEEVHPNMYAYISKEDFFQLLNQLYKQVAHPMNRIEFFKLVAPVVASLENGHTQLYPPDKDFRGYLNKGGKIIPLEFRWDGQNLILDKNYGPQELPVGGRVLEINGQDANELIAKFARYFPDEFRNNNPGWAAKGLIHCLWLEYGQTERLNIRIRPVNGIENAYNVKGIPFSQFQACKNEQQVHKQQLYSYRYIPEYNTGLIELRGFHNSAQYKDFLEKTFRQLKAKITANLIIDIRQNPGGNTSAGDVFLDYLTDKPFRQYEEYRIKASAQVMGLPYIKEHLPDDVKIGAVVTPPSSFRKPKDNPNTLRFNGRKFVLIGQVTFSAANAFASAVKCFNIATLIGEETGGTTTCYGDIFRIDLPNSGLSAACSMKYFVEAGGKPDGRGVLPDYEVKQKPEDTAKGVDTVLQFTLNLIKNSEAKK
jgi:hypothetical protein